jgi:hypothetical protein
MAAVLSCACVFAVLLLAAAARASISLPAPSRLHLNGLADIRQASPNRLLAVEPGTLLDLRWALPLAPGHEVG